MQKKKKLYLKQQCHRLARQLYPIVHSFQTPNQHDATLYYQQFYFYFYKFVDDFLHFHFVLLVFVVLEQDLVSQNGWLGVFLMYRLLVFHRTVLSLLPLEVLWLFDKLNKISFFILKKSLNMKFIFSTDYTQFFHSLKNKY